MNFLKVKKLLAFMLTAIFPAVSMFLTQWFFGDIFLSLGVLVGVSFAFVLVSYLLIATPFSKMEEGEGLAVLTMDSTGVIKPHLAKMAAPLVIAKIEGREKATVFDRNIVFYLTQPLKALFWHKSATKIEIEELKNKENEDWIVIALPRNEFTKSKFGLLAYPTLVYNTVSGIFLTKEMMWELESKFFVHHQLLYLVRKMEELNGLLRDFVRYVIEQLRPTMDFWKKPWFILIIIGIVVVVIAILLGPTIIKMLSGGAQAATGAVAPIVQSRPTA